MNDDMFGGVRSIVVVLAAACGTHASAPPSPQSAAPASPVCGATAVDASAKPSIVPVETWFTSAATWVGDDLLLVRRYSTIANPTEAVGVLEHWSTKSAAAPADRTFCTEIPEALVSTHDGSHLVLAAARTIEIADVRGVGLTRFQTEGQADRLTTVGDGDALVILASFGNRVVLYDHDGRQLDAYSIDGTTPAIKRVYRGEGTRHDNILSNEPSAAVALALSADGKRVAIGGSDSKVRLFDRTTGQSTKLQFAWPYEERRMMGGNPDLELPLAMRFSDDGNQLVVVYGHGEIITWDTTRGVIVSKLAGEGAIQAAISPDGRWLAATDGTVHVRALPSGDPIATIPAQGSEAMVSISTTGVLSIIDLYGSVTLWRPQTLAITFRSPPASTGPLTPEVSSSGRLLAFQLQYGADPVIWDLRSGRSPSAAVHAPDRLLALGDDGKAIVKTATGFELRTALDRPGTPLAIPDGAVTLSTRGDHLLVRTNEGRDNLVRDLDRGTEVTIHVADYTTARLAGDGRHLATFGDVVPLQLWDTATGKLVATLESGVHAVAVFGDGRRIVSLARAGNTTTATIRELTGARPTQLAFPGFPTAVAIAPDDAEILFVLEDRLIRYSMRDGSRRELANLAGVLQAHYTTDGASIVLEDYGVVELRRANTFELEARIYPLLSGGYLVQNAAGEVEGSPDAVASTITRRGGSTALGSVAWAELAKPAVYARALAGR